MNNRRWQFWTPWTLPHWGFMWSMWGKSLSPQRGCDEWHNKSWIFIVPLIGGFVWFPKKGFDRSGGEHLHGRGPEGTYGRIVDDCEICVEILEDFDT